MASPFVKISHGRQEHSKGSCMSMQTGVFAVWGKTEQTCKTKLQKIVVHAQKVSKVKA